MDQVGDYLMGQAVDFHMARVVDCLTDQVGGYLMGQAVDFHMVRVAACHTDQVGVYQWTTATRDLGVLALLGFLALNGIGKTTAHKTYRL
jgi:hypothetical protein